MIPGGVLFRIGSLLGSLPIHPSSVSGRYHISASSFLILHCQRLELVTESVTKPGYSLEIATGTKTLLGSTPLALIVALVEPGLSTGLLSLALPAWPRRPSFEG